MGTNEVDITTSTAFHSHKMELIDHNSDSPKGASIPHGDFDASTPVGQSECRPEVKPGVSDTSGYLDLFTPGTSDALGHFDNCHRNLQDSYIGHQLVNTTKDSLEPPLTPAVNCVHQLDENLNITTQVGSKITPSAPCNSPVSDGEGLWNLEFSQPDFSVATFDSSSVTSFILTSTSLDTTTLENTSIITEIQQGQQFSDPGEALHWIQKELISLRSQDKLLQDQFQSLYTGIQSLKQRTSLLKSASICSSRDESRQDSTDSAIYSADSTTSDHVREDTLQHSTASEPTTNSLSTVLEEEEPPVPPRSTSLLTVNSKANTCKSRSSCKMSIENLQQRPLPSVPGATPMPFTAWAVPSQLPKTKSTKNCCKQSVKKSNKVTVKKPFTTKLKNQLFTACFHSEVSNKGKAMISNVFGDVVSKKKKKDINDCFSDNKENINPNGHQCRKKSKKTSRKISCIPKEEETPSVCKDSHRTLTISAPIPMQSCRDDAVNIYMNGTMVRNVAKDEYNKTGTVSKQEHCVTRQTAQILRNAQKAEKQTVNRCVSSVPLTQPVDKMTMHKTRSDNLLLQNRNKKVTCETSVPLQDECCQERKPLNKPRISYVMPEQEKPRTRTVRLQKQTFPERERTSNYELTQPPLNLFSPVSMELSDNYYSMSDDEELWQKRPHKIFRQSNRLIARQTRHDRRRKRRRVLSPLAESVELGSSYYSVSDSESTFYSSDMAREKYLPRQQYKRYRKKVRDTRYAAQRNTRATYRSCSRLSLLDSDSSMSQFPCEDYHRPVRRDRRPLGDIHQSKRKRDSQISVFDERFSKATKTKVSTSQLSSGFEQSRNLRNRRYSSQGLCNKQNLTKLSVDERAKVPAGKRKWRRETTVSHDTNNTQSKSFFHTGNGSYTSNAYEDLYSTGEWVV